MILKEKCVSPYEVNLPEEMTHNDFDLDEDIINPVCNFIKKHCMVEMEQNNLQNIDEEIKKLKEIPKEIKDFIDEKIK